MSDIYQRRGNAELAGTPCQFDYTGRPCKVMARYEVSAISDSGELENGLGACGQHITEAIRIQWKMGKHATVVQEIPGMWR